MEDRTEFVGVALIEAVEIELNRLLHRRTIVSHAHSPLGLTILKTALARIIHLSPTFTSVLMNTTDLVPRTTRGCDCSNSPICAVSMNWLSIWMVTTPCLTA